MSFKQVKHQIITCLKLGAYDHEFRKSIDVKNLFQCGLISENEVLDLVMKTTGNQYETSPHHQAPSIDVHIFKPQKNRKKWYIKFYFIEPDAMFISVHESDEA